MCLTVWVFYFFNFFFGFFWGGFALDIVRKRDWRNEAQRSGICILLAEPRRLPEEPTSCAVWAPVG